MWQSLEFESEMRARAERALDALRDEQRLQEEKLQAHSAQAADSEAEVAALDDGRMRIDFTGDSPAEALVEQAVAGGWRLQELTAERHTLEQIFIELTTGDAPGHASGAAA